MTATQADRGFARWLGVVALLGWLARLASIGWLPTQPVDDFWSYFERARLLAVAGQYGPFLGRPDAGYPPAYPLLLALAHLAAGDPLLVAKLLDSLLGVATIVLAGLLARRLAGPVAGVLGAALVAFHPRHLLLTPVLASEHLFTPLLLLWVLLMSLAWRRPAPRRLVAVAGLVLAAMALTRPVGYPLGAFWPLGALVAGKRWRPVLAETALLLAVQHAVMLPWALRNEATLGRFTFLSSVGGIDLFIGNSEGATGDWYDWEPALRSLQPAVDRRQVFALDDAARRQAMAWIEDHPRRALALYRLKLARILLADQGYAVFYGLTGEGMAPPVARRPVIAGAHPLAAHSARVAWLLTVWHRGLLILGIAGCGWLAAQARRHRSREVAAQAVAIIAIAAYFPLVTAVFLGSSRFAWPTADLLLAPAAVLLAALFGKARPCADAAAAPAASPSTGV